MKTRHWVDALGNVYNQEWADADYPAEFAAEDAINDNLDNAFVDLRAFINTAAPNQAATVAIVKTLCRVVIWLIRVQRRKFDGTN